MPGNHIVGECRLKLPVSAKFAIDRMPEPVREATLLSVVACVACLLFIDRAIAGDGPCALETGIWAFPSDACQYARTPDEAARRFGQAALLELNRGYYRLEGAHCTFFSATLASKLCTLEVECASEKTRSHGQFDIMIESARQLRFGTRPDSPVYRQCAGDAPR